ncbi:MAG: tubulin-like doman-containing protein [Capsulimonadaceae bacterium]
MKKSIVIGLGGTGTEVVELLRKRLNIYGGTDSPSECRFIYVDTDVQNNPVVRTRPAEFCKMTVDQETVNTLRKPESQLAQRINIATWMDPDRLRHLSPLSKGADGVRAYGRLALLAGAELATFIGLMRTSVAQLLADSEGNDPEVGTSAALRVFVIASAGGGSGSGFFIDIGYLTRMLLPKSGQWEQVGIVAVAPTGLKLEQGDTSGKQQNSAALLDEIDHFSRRNDVFTANYNNMDLPDVIGCDPPYQYCYVVSPMAGAGALAQTTKGSVDIMKQRIADMVFMRLTGPGEIASRQSDFLTNFYDHPQDQMGYPNVYCTFGVSLRQFPAKKYLEESIGLAITGVANKWLKTSMSDIERLRLCKPAYEELQSELGLPPGHVQNAGSKRDVACDRLYLKLVSSDQTSPLEVMKGARTAADIKNLCAYQEGAPVDVSRDGYFTGTVFHNRDESVKALVTRIQKESEKFAFDVVTGPNVALAFLSYLQETILKEKQFIEACIDKMKGSQPGPAAAAVRRVRDPWLGPWQGTARSTAPTAEPRLAEEKNRQIEMAVLNAKLQIYTQVLAKIEALRPGLAQLASYITKWRDVWGGAADQSWRVGCPPGVVLADDIVQAKIARFAIKPDPKVLSQVEKAYRVEAFASSLPKTPEGKLDLRPFLQIEEAIKKALSSAYDNDGLPIPATETIFGESVVRLMGEKNQGNWQIDGKSLVKEAWPPLMLNITDTDYAYLLPGNPAGFKNKVEFYSLINNAAAHLESHAALRDVIQKEHTNVNNEGGVPVVAPIQEWTTDIEPALAGIVYLRASFPSRIIAGLGPDDRRQLLGDSASLHYARADVLPPALPKEIDAASARLLLLETLRIGNCMPPGLTIERTRYSIVYRDDAVSLSGIINPARWTMAVHELAVKTQLSSKVDELLTKHLRDPANRGETAAAIAELRALMHDAKTGNNSVSASGLTWTLEPTDVLDLLTSVEEQYRIALSDSDVKSARKLMLTLLTLVNNEQLRADLSTPAASNGASVFGSASQVALPPFSTTAKSHVFTYIDALTGIQHQRKITLSKLNPNIAARTLAANTTAKGALEKVWIDLQHVPGGTGDIASALVGMIAVVRRLPVNAYCPQMDMFGLDADGDVDLLCEVAQPIVPDNVHPWATKNEQTNEWSCGACGFRMGAVKPGLQAKCSNPACPGRG